MASGLDSVINAVAPWIILVVGVYLLYRPLAKPLSGMFNWIKGLFSRKAEILPQGARMLQYE